MIRAVASLLAGRAGLIACRLVTTVLLARLLPTDEFGRFTFLVGFFTIYQQLTSLSVEQAAAVEVASSHDRRRSVTTLLVISVVLGLVSWGLFVPVSALARTTLFEGISDRALVLLGAVLPAAHLLSACRGVVAGSERFNQVTTLLTSPWIGFLLGVVFLTLSDTASLDAAAFAFFLPIVLVAVLGVGLVSSDLTWRLAIRSARRVLEGLGKVHLTQVLTLLQMRLDLLIVRYFSTPEQVAYYGIATNMTEWMLYLPRALAVAVLPRSARSEPLSVTYLRVQSTAMMGVGALVVFLSPLAVPAIFGATFKDAVWVVIALVPGTVFLANGIVASSALLGSKRFGVLYKIGFSGLFAFVVLDAILVPMYGAFGAAVVSSVVYAAAGLGYVGYALSSGMTAAIGSFAPVRFEVLRKGWADAKSH